jgi:chromosome segregation ATPase
MWGKIWNAIIGWLTKRESAAVAIDGFDRLNMRQNEWIEHVERRLRASEKRADECEEDRKELHKRADDCDEDREKLHTKVSGLESKISELEVKTNGH